MNSLRKIFAYFFTLKKMLIKEQEQSFIKQEQHYQKWKSFENVNLKHTTVGTYSYIAHNSIIHNCSIGKFSSIGPNVVIGFGEHPISFLSTSPIFYTNENMFQESLHSHNSFNGKLDVKIGNDVWIGASVFIKNGISIGDGAIIGACSVVTKDVPPYAIVIGVPAKILKYRFDTQEIEKLLRIKWWDWDIEKIKLNKESFTTTNLNSFLNNHQS